jgi:hypothetical protein
MSNHSNLFASVAKCLSLVWLFFLCACAEAPRFVIHDGRFFEYPIEPPVASGFKIASRDELHQYIDKCEIEAARKHLRDMETISFARSFLYISVTAELVDIRSVPGVAVSNAILRKSMDSGLWIYVIDGDSSVPIKATSEPLPKGNNTKLR